MVDPLFFVPWRAKARSGVLTTCVWPRQCAYLENSCIILWVNEGESEEVSLWLSRPAPQISLSSTLETDLLQFPDRTKGLS